MSSLATAGALAVGSVGVAILLTVVLVAWIWANEKVQKPEFEPTLPLSLLVTAATFTWFMDKIAGDVGVFGVICGASVWGYFLYTSYTHRNRSPWNRLRAWFQRNVRKVR